MGKICWKRDFASFANRTLYSLSLSLISLSLSRLRKFENLRRMLVPECEWLVINGAETQEIIIFSSRKSTKRGKGEFCVQFKDNLTFSNYSPKFRF